MKVHWTEAALADLHGIESYIARHSAHYARGVVARIFARAGQLESHPMLGAVVPEYQQESLRELPETPFRIIYRVSESQVDVVAVVHAARQMPRGL